MPPSAKETSKVRVSYLRVAALGNPAGKRVHQEHNHHQHHRGGVGFADVQPLPGEHIHMHRQRANRRSMARSGQSSPRCPPCKISAAVSPTMRPDGQDDARENAAGRPEAAPRLNTVRSLPAPRAEAAFPVAVRHGEERLLRGAQDQRQHHDGQGQRAGEHRIAPAQSRHEQNACRTGRTVWRECPRASPPSPAPGVTRLAIAAERIPPGRWPRRCPGARPRPGPAPSSTRY